MSAMWETSTVGSAPISLAQIEKKYPGAKIGDKAQTRPTQQELDRLTRKFPSKKDRKR